MKFGAADLRALKTSVLTVVLMVAGGAAAVNFSLSASVAASLARGAAQAERNDFDGKLRRVRGEESEIRQNSAVFDKLKASGIIGDEQRLEWVELLKEIRDRRQLIDLRYEFGPQRALDDQPTGGFAFHASLMKLQVDLLHEEDLTGLLGDLRQNASAFIQIRSCLLSRLAPSASAAGALLRGDCQIDWVTLREAAVKVGTPGR